MENDGASQRLEAGFVAGQEGGSQKTPFANDESWTVQIYAAGGLAGPTETASSKRLPSL